MLYADDTGLASGSVAADDIHVFLKIDWKFHFLTTPDFPLPPPPPPPPRPPRFFHSFNLSHVISQRRHSNER